MNLLFSSVTDNLSYKTFLGLVNSTSNINKVLVIYKGKFEFKFERDVEIIMLKYDDLILGDYKGFEKEYTFVEEENKFVNTFNLDMLYMMNRIHRFYSFSFSDRYNALKNHVKGSIGLFNTFKPDVCLFINMQKFNF